MSNGENWRGDKLGGMSPAEIDAFLDFCRYRERARSRNPNLSREEYLAIKRRELHALMRRRRESRFSGTRTSGSPREIQ